MGAVNGKRGRDPRTADEVPLCFVSREEFKLWLTTRGARGTESEFCTDCTPGYQAAMIRAGRCAYPGTLFERDRKGDLIGVRPGCGSNTGPRKPREEGEEDAVPQASA